MRTSIMTLVLSGATFIACNPFHKEPATQVTVDANVNSRWRASLVTPANLGGAVQINGEATMQPGRNGGNTEFTLSLANATAGGDHPWQVHRGQCGSDYGVFGSAGAYKSIKVDDEGRGTGRATVALTTPTTGEFFVTVQASAANPETTVACGNLAPPAR